ncbi:transposase [Acinetobacter proteolyticus]|uniref:Transposase n=1 Tax=Acinetobacter proteolyticus TaxID=1776741 RepID=A0A653K8N5_9GAMM|nr:transposase DDE domain protein [Acinetobacter sp. WC-141]VXA57334.1 transposase [Acinetobacter proteolyticus]
MGFSYVYFLANCKEIKLVRSSLSYCYHMDWYLYKIRHLVENMFCRLKQFRGIATRYDKLKRNYQSAVALACIFLWLPL